MRALLLAGDQVRLRFLLLTASAAFLFAVTLLYAIQSFPIRWFGMIAAGIAIFLVAVISGKFERFMLGLIFFAIPFNVDVYFNIGPSLLALRLPSGTPRFGISVIDLALTLLYPLWLLRLALRRDSEKVVWPPGTIWFLCFIGWAGLSIVNAQNRLLSFFMLANFAKLFFLFFYLANHIRTREDLWFAVRLLFIGLIAECLLCLAQQASGSNLGLHVLGERLEEKELALSTGRFLRVGGTLGHPNFLGAYLTSLLPVALAVSLSSIKLSRRLLAFAGLILGSLVLVLSFSRSAWLTTATAFAIMLTRLFFQTKKNSSAGLFLALVVLVGGMVLAPLGPLIKARLGEDDRGSSSSRIPQWQMGFTMLKAHPILGVGLNNYSVVSQNYETYVVDPNNKGRVFLYNGRLHNFMLAVAAEVGIVGLFWFLLFLWKACREGWKKMKEAKGDWSEAIFFGLILGLCCRILNDIVHTGNLALNMIVWTYTACLLSGFKPRDSQNE